MCAIEDGQWVNGRGGSPAGPWSSPVRTLASCPAPWQQGLSSRKAVTFHIKCPIAFARVLVIFLFFYSFSLLCFLFHVPHQLFCSFIHFSSVRILRYKSSLKLQGCTDDVVVFFSFSPSPLPFCSKVFKIHLCS